MEYAGELPASQTKRTVVTSIVALVIGAAAATGIWAIADDDGTASGNTSTPTAVSDNPGSQYGTAQYRLPDAQPTVPENTPYGAKYRFAHP
jgi:hypothetical protein